MTTSPTPAADWIEWTGGENPVERLTIVEAKRRDGSVITKTAFKFDSASVASRT